MTVAYWCVLVMIIFPYLFATLAKASLSFNNAKPREYAAALTGWRQRANYIQLNSFEALSTFGLAVIIAHLAHASQINVDRLAIIYVISRAIYAICYLAKTSMLRTFFWSIGFFCIIGLFYISAL